ncbi:unnamed protein product [Rotaria sp. Silwood2]|nr:unnamed protein product [Rotaria sp. Silwood2]CAF3944573.1 unnamed protein product [Rotaria sp. Silwood2]
MLNQEQIHRYFNHLSGAKRIEFLYGLLHLCQPLELRYLGTCLEEIARKDYEYLYHAEQKTNHLPTQNLATTNNETNNQPQNDLGSEEKLDLTDQFTRAHAIVDIALLWAKNRPCALRLFRRLKASESIKLIDMLLERDDLDERTMDEILIIFCLAANHPAFSFDMRTQMSQTLKELEKRQRKMKLLQPVQSNNNDDEIIDPLDDTTCLRHHILSSSLLNSSTLSVHASPLLTRLVVVNYDTESTPLRILIKADWSDNNSTLTWKTPNDIRSFHLQLSNIVYHDDVRLERLMNISGYLRDIGSPSEPDIELMKQNIATYMTHLVYFSSYISTISTLAKFFNSSLKLVDSKQRLFNSSNGFDEPLSSSSSFSNGVTPLQCELPVQQPTESENKTHCSPKLLLNNNKSKQQTDVAKQARSIVPTHNGTQTGLEVRCEETQTDRMPGPGFILAEHQDYLRRYSMDELAKLTPADLIADGLDQSTAQLLCGALDDLKPMSVHLSSSSAKNSRSPCTFVQMPSSSLSPPPLSQPPSLPPLLDAALMTVVQQQQQPSRTPPPGFDRNQYEPILINLAGAHPSLSSSPSPKLPKTGATTSGKNSIPPLPPPPPPLPLPPPPSTSNCPSQTQHHVPLLTAHSFLYNSVEPYMFPIAIPPGFPSTTPDFMRLFAPNMAAVATNPTNTSFVQTSNTSQGSVSNSRSTTQSNGTNTPPEQNGQNHHPSPPPQSSSRHQQQQQQAQQQQQQQSHQSQQHHQQQSHHRHRQYHQSDSIQFQPQNGFHAQQRQTQTSYPQQHVKPKACYTCGDLGHLAFACPEQYSSDSNYPHNTRDSYKLDYRPRQSTPTNIQQQQQRQMRSNSKTKVRDNS